MQTTGQLHVGDFLDSLAARQSAPGGGGAAALTGSQAAALLSMVANFTLGNKKYAAVEAEMTGYLAQSETLRHLLLVLADEDVAAFNGVAACYAMPKESDAEKAARSAAIQAALQEAARVPMSTAERSVEVMQLAAAVGAKGNTNMVSDAAVALYLAHAALQAAIVNVNINLKSIKDATFVAECAARRDDLLATGATALDAGKAACEAGLGFSL